jgi:hypothetical protein
MFFDRPLECTMLPPFPDEVGKTPPPEEIFRRQKRLTARQKYRMTLVRKKHHE